MDGFGVHKKMKTGKKEYSGLFNSVFMAHFILFLHVVLIAGIGFLVLFFRGVVFYMPWIVLGGTVAVLGSGYLFYRRAKKEGKSLRELLSLPMFRGRSVEVSFLGGLASVKVNPPDDARTIAEEVTADAEAAVAESIFRRQAMIVAVVAIGLIIVALYLLKRELDRRLDAEGAEAQRTDASDS